MKIGLSLPALCALFLCSLGYAQDTAPTTLAGKTAVVVVSSGSGAFSPIGGYRISFSASNATYTIAPLASTVLPGAGTYTYTKTGANTGRITVVDSTVGAGVAQTLIFTSPTTATYSITSTLGAQTGTLVMENGSSGSGLSNMSVRAVVPANGQIIPGLVLDAATRVLVRVAGPALAGFGVSGTLPNPKFTLMNGNAAVITNDDWSSTTTNQAAVVDAANRTGAFVFVAGSRDAAAVVDLAPGNYTCIISGDAGTSGEVILEVYRVPSNP